MSAYLDTMRFIKDQDEIDCLRKAVSISSQAHQRAMRFCKPGVYEYEVAAEIHHEFERQGCQTRSYESIVASGSNACILHYESNTDKLHDNQLILIDAGCEYQYYAADITRTFPINGKFNQHQKKLYEIVLRAQTAAIQAMKPEVRWGQLEELVDAILLEGLMNLDLITSRLSYHEKMIALRSFYPHSLGHSLGLDVHDTPLQLQPNTILSPGMVVTIEPGIYIQEHISPIASEWRGIGIRIEDDVLITATGNEILSESIPKTIEDIEYVMKK